MKIIFIVAISVGISVVAVIGVLIGIEVYPQAQEQTQSEISCDPSYPDVCIPPYPPDLDCGEISFKNFKVLPPDPHRFDGDKDGIGCQS